MSPFNAADDLLLLYLPSVSLRVKSIYWLLLGGICLVMILLPLIYVDISVRNAGVIRPEQERMELKMMVTASIDSIYYREGDEVPHGSLIMRLYDPGLRAKMWVNHQELEHRRRSIHDLQLLIAKAGWQAGKFPDQRLMLDLYRQEAAGFISQTKEQEAGLKKVYQELSESEQLSKGQVISRKELYDKQVEHEQKSAAYRSFMSNRLQVWQEQLLKCRAEYAQFELQRRQLVNEGYLYELRAPVRGRLQGFSNRYPGANVQAGESIGFLSPAGNLVAECYVPARDIGMIRQGQQVYFQIEALDYNYFGSLGGQVRYIDHDFTLRENRPFFKVISSLDSTHLCLRNGYRIALRKGMTFQSRFMVARRSLWQLFFDRMDDWLNPAAPEIQDTY